VPCILRYPRRIKAGTVCDAFITSLDIVPTLLNEAGVRAPPDVVLDGYNVMPTLAEGAPSPRGRMFWQRKDDKAARVGQWKWVESSHGGGLFNLAEDAGETKDLSKAFPEKREELKAAFAQWKAAMDAAEPRGPFRDY
jgi:arylsulfatase A-like enzyme